MVVCFVVSFILYFNGFVIVINLFIVKVVKLNNDVVVEMKELIC